MDVVALSIFQTLLISKLMLVNSDLEQQWRNMAKLSKQLSVRDKTTKVVMSNADQLAAFNAFLAGQLTRKNEIFQKRNATV